MLSLQGSWANRGAWPLRYRNWSGSGSPIINWPKRPMEEI
jgi:hypothetical protein